MDWRFLLIAVIVSIFGVVAGRYDSQADAKRFLDRSSNSLFELFNDVSDTIYNNEVIDLDQSSEMSGRIGALVKEIALEARKYKVEQFSNPTVIKGLRKLRSAEFYALDDDYLKSLTSSLVALRTTATDNDICNYFKTDQCKMAHTPDIQRIFSKSLNPRELEYYWVEWREKQLGYGIFHFINVVEFFRKAADDNGIPVRDLWFRQYDDPDFFDNMEKVMLQLKPFYQEFHAYVRQQLVLKYGSQLVNPDGPIPHHLIEQVLLQAWNKQSVLSHAYPKDRLPNLQDGLESQGFDITKIIYHAENFYQSLGFDSIPPKIAQERFKIVEKDCQVNIFTQTPKIFMKYCRAPSFKRFLQTHGYLGRLHYALEMKDQPYYFFSSFDLEYPLGESVILSASTPNHMNRAEILNQFNYTNEVAMNRLFRMGVHTIFNIAQYFVNTKVMLDVLEGRVPLERVNRHYWKVMDEFAGFEPPVDRRQKYLDFSAKFFEDLTQNHQTRKFVSEVLGYQMYESFCLMSGGFVPVDPKKPLHACDFFGSHEVGDAMKSMMKLGSSLSWRAAISRAVPGATAMSAYSLLEYYKPLHEWLREKNRVLGTKVGWNPSTKVVF